MFISIHALFWIAMIFVVLFVGIVSIMAIINLNRLLKSVNNLVIENTNNINKSLETLPCVLENANDVVLRTRESVDQVSDMVASVTKKSICDRFYPNRSGHSDGIFAYIHSISEAIKAIVSFLHEVTANRE